VQLDHLEHVDDLEDAAKFQFLDDSATTSVDAVERSFLSPFNARVDAFHQLMLETIPGSITRIQAKTRLKNSMSPASTYQVTETDLLAVLHEPGIPPHDLSLKVGCITTIMRNLSMEKGLVKNARVQVVSVLPNVVQVRVLRRHRFRPQTLQEQEQEPATFYLSRLSSNPIAQTGLFNYLSVWCTIFKVGTWRSAGSRKIHLDRTRDRPVYSWPCANTGVVRSSTTHFKVSPDSC